MSIALMTLAWKCGAPAGQKMVLLALCDNANDQGECYPSIPMLARKCSMSERSVQNHISDMVEQGVIIRSPRAGRSTVYHIDYRNFRTPAESAPPKPLHPTPATAAPVPPQAVHHSPAKVAPRTTSKPSSEPSGETPKGGSAAEVPFKPLDALLALGVTAKAANDWLKVRKEKKAPLTETALDRIQVEAEKAGLTMQELVELCCEKSWQGFSASWVEPKQAVPARAGQGAAGGAYAQSLANAEAARALIFGKGSKDA